jgi:hypothetical protein
MIDWWHLLLHFRIIDKIQSIEAALNVVFSGTHGVIVVEKIACRLGVELVVNLDVFIY